MLFPTALVSHYSAEIVIRDVTDVLWLLRDYFRPFRDDTDVLSDLKCRICYGRE